MFSQSISRFRKLQFLFVLSILAVSLTYCSSPETTIVDREPEASTQETSDTAKVEDSGDGFKHLKVGTIYPIHSLDPLFASNPAELRTIQALYETLVKYNEEGKLVPALASDWEISDDSLEYTFQLRSEIFYHDSQVFANGIGRRFVSADVINVFQRMARPGVPEQAAKMFSSIKGFEPYFKEQHQVHLEKLRSINGIEGITTVEENSIRFTLKRKDPQFLHKLASPYASIYPIEASNNEDNTLHTNPVGTGPYQFTEMPGDSSLVVEQFDNYVYKSNGTENSYSTPPINRIDINHFTDQRQLLRYFSNEDIDLIHELSPRLKNMMLDSLGNAKDLSFNYQLYKSDARPVITIRINPDSDKVLNPDQAAYLDKLAQPEFFNLLTPVNKEIKTLYRIRPTAITDKPPKLPATIYGSYADHPVLKTYYRVLATEVDEVGNSEFSVLPVRVPISDIELYGEQPFQIQPNQTEFDSSKVDTDLVHAFSLKHYAVSGESVKGARYNKLPWWVDYSKLNLSNN